MGFQQGLSGLNGASKALDSVGNNIANSNTVGFKSATTAFADVFAASLGGAVPRSVLVSRWPGSTNSSPRAISR